MVQLMESLGDCAGTHDVQPENRCATKGRQRKPLYVGKIEHVFASRPSKQSSMGGKAQP